MKVKKTFKETRNAMWKISWVDTPFKAQDGKYYKQNYIYGFITSMVHFILIFAYIFIFLGIMSFFIKNNLIVMGIAVGIISILIIEYVIEFLFTFFAPLKEVEKPKEEVKKMGFFDRYKRYKEKRMNQLKDEDKK